MSGQPSQPVAELLAKRKLGDPRALAALIPVVDNELSRPARHCLRRERDGDTPHSTALPDEAYVRLVCQGRRTDCRLRRFHGCGSATQLHEACLRLL